MRPAVVLAFATLAICVIALAALAQTALPPIPDNPPVRMVPLQVDFAKTGWGDPKAGQTKAAICTACHGPHGNPLIDMYPRIAGQSERYIAQQLALIANGQRDAGAVAAMRPFAQALTGQDMRDIGAYFALQRPGSGRADEGGGGEVPAQNASARKIAQQLYRGGDPTRGIPACLACHGPTGAGDPGPAYPRVGGQHATYLARRLQEYRSGRTTETDPYRFDTMAEIARPLTDPEIQALSRYLQDLRDPDRQDPPDRRPAAAPR